ncbi:MAG: AAA family ATPase [Limnochordia bacterium]|jgi:MoxR-like ATPase
MRNALPNEVAEVQQTLERVRNEIGKSFVGHPELVNELLVALLANGHVLLEGIPGLGKTLLVRTVGQVLDLSFSRIQFTPDLMPADIIGTSILVQSPSGERTFRFQRGPLFANIVLADEINRASPKTQSALLEAMQEGHVTAGGQTYELPGPFFVLATQNPIEMEGTYPLPEAQVDRFMFKLRIDLPDMEDMRTILDRTTGAATPEVFTVLTASQLQELQELVREVPIASHLRDLAIRIVLATHPGKPEAPDVVNNYVRLGASPRGAQSLVIAAKAWALMSGRFNVSQEDIHHMVLPALRHRLLLSFAGEAEGITTEEILTQVLTHVTKSANPSQG